MRRGGVAWGARRLGRLKGRIAFLVAFAVVATIITLHYFGRNARTHDSPWQHAGDHDVDAYAG
jgi:hypothetical protein